MKFQQLFFLTLEHPLLSCFCSNQLHACGQAAYALLTFVYRKQGSRVVALKWLAAMAEAFKTVHSKRACIKGESEKNNLTTLFCTQHAMLWKLRKKLGEKNS